MALGKHGLNQLRLGMASKHWVDVNAIVQQFGFHQEGPRSDASASTWIEYSYEVDGQTYRGDLVGFGVMTGADLPKIPDKGDVISIKYNPENIGESVWIAGTTGSATILSVIAAVLGLVSAGILIANLRGIRTG